MNFVNLDSQQVTLNDFDILEMIEQSSDYSVVYKALDKRSGRIVAIKMITVVDQKDLNILIQALQKQQRPWKHVCQVYDTFGQDGNAFIVMEYFAGGSIKDLLNLLKQDGQILDFEVTQQSVKFINIILCTNTSNKAANILLSAEGQIKLSYFSPDKQFTDTLFKSKSHIISLPYWLPPETIELSIFDQQGDIWALGITAFELITGKIPYEDVPPQKAIFLIAYNEPPKLPSHYPKDMQNFVDCCLNKDPKLRSHATDLQNHPLIKQAKKTQLLFELFEKQTNLKRSTKLPKFIEEGMVLIKNESKQDSAQQNYMHKRVRTSFRVNSKGLLVVDGSQTFDSKSNGQISPQTFSQGNSLSLQNFVLIPNIEITDPQQTKEPVNDNDTGQAFLAIKRTIRKIEKYKPGFTKIMFQEIISAYKELDASDYKHYFQMNFTQE